MCNCDCELTKQAKRQQTREETALEIGRDLMEQGLIPTLIRLVGAGNASRILAGICGCPCDACTEYCEQGALEPCCGQPDACCGCSCPPQEDDDLTRPVAADCGVHGDDGCIANGLTAPPCDGVERDPSTCRCPCYGCKHHCGAHEEPGVCIRRHACGQADAGPCNGLPRDGVVFPRVCARCGATEVVYQNFQGKWLCCSCAQCCDTTEKENRGSRIADAARAWIRRVLRHQ